MKKGLDSDDKEIWEKVTRTVKGYAAPRSSAAAVPKKAAKAPKAAAPPARTAPPSFDQLLSAKLAPAAKTVKKPDFDAGAARKLKQGKMKPEGRIDLHGMTQAEAFDAFTRFISRAQRAGKRTVLVITGKGPRLDGVLRRALPLWLEGAEMRPKILAFSTAPPADGGEGAFYIQLRKSPGA